MLICVWYLTSVYMKGWWLYIILKEADMNSINLELKNWFILRNIHSIIFFDYIWSCFRLYNTFQEIYYASLEYQDSLKYLVY